MKKKSLKLNLIAFCSVIFIEKGCAVESISNKEDTLFPEQPSLIYNPITSVINPFKMSSFSAGGGLCESPDSIRNIFKILAPSHWSHKAAGSYFELRTEIPYYQDKINLGFEVTFGECGVAAHRFVNPSVLFTCKARLPFYTPLGNFSLNITPKIGPTFLYRNIGYPGVGATLGAGLGIDYYFNQWLGAYFEYSVKYSCIPLFLVPRGTKTEPYYYPATGFSFGIKTTF